MGWQDAPVVEDNGKAKPKWMDAPAVDEPAAPPQQAGWLGGVMDAEAAFRAGANQGMTFGFGDELYAGVTAPFRAIPGLFDGSGYDIGRAYEEGLGLTRETIERDLARNPTAGMVGDVVGSVVTGGTLAKGGVTLMNGAKSTIPSMAARGAAEGAIYGGVSGAGRAEGGVEDRLREAAWGAGLGAATGGVLGAGTGYLASRSAKAAVPTVGDLKAAAGARYKVAEQSGVVAPRPATIGLSDTMHSIAVKEGLVSPTGRISGSYPKIAEILKTVDDYANGTMSVPQMQSVRRTLQDAAGSIDKGERRIGKIMLDKFDEFTSSLAPALREGDALYHQAKKGEAIEQAIELARIRSNQYSQSGMENALRTEFRALQRKIAKGQLRGLSQAEIDAINKVANGGALTNALRYVGKFAPSGVVSFGASGGIPFMVGNAVAGPVAGAAAAGTTMGTGFLGKAGAEALTKNAAVAAALLARNGGAAPSAQALSQGQREVLRALIAAGGNEAARVELPWATSAARAY